MFEKLLIQILVEVFWHNRGHTQGLYRPFPGMMKIYYLWNIVNKQGKEG